MQGLAGFKLSQCLICIGINRYSISKPSRPSTSQQAVKITGEVGLLLVIFTIPLEYLETIWQNSAKYFELKAIGALGSFLKESGNN